MKSVVSFSAILMAFLVMACAQTSSTQRPRAPAPEGRETSQTTSQEAREKSQSAGSKTADPSQSDQREAGEQSPSGEPSATESATGRPRESRSPTAVESKSQPSESESGTQRASAEQSADAKLAEARENLRISQETERQIARELEELKATGSASPEAVKDYETYLRSVEAMTAENRKIVEQMEAAYAKKSSGQDGLLQPSGPQGEPDSGFDIPEEQSVDEVAALDRQLDSSLAKFDGMLLKEMDEIRAGSSKKLRDLAEEAAEAAKRLRDQGYDTASGESSSSGEDQNGETTGSETDSEGKSTGDRTSASDQSRKGGEGSSGRDQRRVSYEDDDIVARQLREAAENETDPELKKKLWKEYEEYKKGR